MKIKENGSDSKDSSTTRLKKNDSLKKKSKTPKENFEVRVPRIIVRNLDFKVKEELLKKTFERHFIAEIENISIVTKDGKSKGFGFVTFAKLEDAQKAIEEMNGKKVLGRPMAVDWSLPKNVYLQMQSAKSWTAKEHESYGIQSNPTAPAVKVEKKEIPEIKQEEKEWDDDEDEDEDGPQSIPSKMPMGGSSRDVREHRTLFVRNIPFDASEEELSELFSSNKKYRIVSCRLVIDPISKHPRGSAFIQFASNEDAQQCLDQTLSLRGQELQMDLALSRDDLNKARQIRDEKHEKAKKADQRNLALANYGVILSLAQLDGNENDLRKRQQLEDAKKEKLKNALYFVSPTRLTVHNLPTNIDDKQLRHLVLQTLKRDKIPLKDVILNECRVMRREKEARKSLRYAFLNFTQHEHALRLIDLMNNNKHICGPERRPIVQFAIENRRALQLKEQRQDRLRAKAELMKNPTNQTVAFDASNNKKKKEKERQKNFVELPKNKTRLSALVSNDEKQETMNSDDDDSAMNIDVDQPMSDEKKNVEQRRRRPKNKSKGEIRDQFDRMIAKTRNKLPLPERSKQKWFE